jgi:hypothetical protein
MDRDGLTDSGKRSESLVGVGRATSADSRGAPLSYGAASSRRFVSPLCRGRVEMDTDSIGLVVLEGVLTPGGLDGALAWIQEAALARATGVVIDFRAVVVGVDSAALCRPGGLGAPNVPLAAVATREAISTFREWAWQCALEGAIRSVFKDEAQALAWVRDRAWIARL